LKVEVEKGSMKTAIGHRFVQMRNLKAEVKKDFIFPFWGGLGIFRKYLHGIPTHILTLSLPTPLFALLVRRFYCQALVRKL